MEDSETNESVRWTEMTTRTQTTEDIINPWLTVSDVTQNKLKETDEMDLDTVKHNSESRSSQERSQNNIKSHSLSLDQGTFSGLVPSGPSPFLLASLQSLIEDDDHMLLPHSLHQNKHISALLAHFVQVKSGLNFEAKGSIKIAEAYFLEKDYQWAVEFLQLEKLYHERLLSNLASIQEQWESQCWVGVQTKSISPLNANGMDREREHMESLSHICRTHQRPNLPAEKKMLQNSPSHVTEHRGSKQEQALVNSSGRENRVDDSSSWLEAKQVPEEDCEDEDEEDLEADECWNEDLQEEVEIGSQGPVDELAKLIQVEEMFPSDGLVSILKKRVCVRGAESLNSAPDKDFTMRKVRFREPDDAFDQDESTRKSCLVLLLLCLITVVISIGGTALYCLIGGAYSNCVEDIITDVAEPESLASMCKQAIIVLNCVGPYRFYGKPVMKACIENEARCIDICGDPQLRYHAQKNGVYMIGGFGFDSIQADMGILYTGSVQRGVLFFSKKIEQYAIPFIGSDPSVVRWAQRYLHEDINTPL